MTPTYLSALEHGRRGRPNWGFVQRVIQYFNVIWDDAEELQRLAEVSHPRVVIDTAGLSPQATLLANRLARGIAGLGTDDSRGSTDVLARPPAADARPNLRPGQRLTPAAPDAKATVATPTGSDLDMTAPRFDVLGLGNAIVDVLARTEDDFLVANDLHKGSMRLIDEPEAERLYGGDGAGDDHLGRLGRQLASSASPRFGGRAAYIGKVRADEVGAAFHPRHPRHRRPLRHRAGAGRPRHGAQLHPGHAGRRAHDEHLSRRLPESRPRRRRPRHGARRRPSSISRAISGIASRPRRPSAAPPTIAHAAGRQVALTLSDSFCVDRYRDEFLGLIRSGTLDILFANEHELKSLYETADFDTRARRAARRGAEGRTSSAS